MPTYTATPYPARAQTVNELQLRGLLDDLVGLDDVADLEVVVARDHHAALEAVPTSLTSSLKRRRLPTLPS